MPIIDVTLIEGRPNKVKEELIAKLTEAAVEFTGAPIEIIRVTGLEAWFDLPEVPAAKHAPQWKMAITLIVVVFIIVFLLQLIVMPPRQGWPHAGRTLLIAMIQVLLMIYLFMPRVTKLLRGWLFT